MILSDTWEMLRRQRQLRISKRGAEWSVQPVAHKMAITGYRLVVIIHGYNNREVAASKSYKAFYKELLKFLPNYEFNHVWEVYWPGYWQLRPFDIEELSWSSYSFKVLDTPNVGQALADHLNQINSEGQRVRDVLFIAHSLGCRIVLETVKRLSESGGLNVAGICLMAAAVPTSMVSGGGSLRTAAEYADKRYILYSTADSVLRWAFRPGQFFATGQTPEAVGRFGNPRSFWDRRHENVVNTGLKHDEYYTGRPKRSPLALSRTSSTVARMFGCPLPMYPRETDPYVVDWSVESSPPLPRHEVGERNLG